jgi:hypothetical protein
LSDLYAEFDAAETERLLASVDEGRRRQSLPTMLAVWRSHIRLYQAQLDLDFAVDARRWHGDDYVGSLLRRDRIKIDARSLPVGLRKKVVRWLGTVDREFTNFAEEDDRGLALRRADELHIAVLSDPDWSWRRIPARGPVRADLEAGSECRVARLALLALA